MGIDNISEVREALRRTLERLRQHQMVYARNEAAVREQLVLPVLRSLGWDTENPAEVHPEERGSTGFADYTLKVNGRPIVTVEVKKGDQDVAEPGALEQAHRHASAAGIKLSLATNGSQWILARSFEEGRDLRGRIKTHQSSGQSGRALGCSFGRSDGVGSGDGKAASRQVELTV